MNTNKKLCIYCGSSRGNNPIYTQLAKELGIALVKNNITLVYGGAHVGLMGVIADTVMQSGGSAVGVIS